MDQQTQSRLVEAAYEARTNAYAPYSVYKVGAAALSSHGAIYVGCNVENASFGTTICAERNAIAAMVVNGERELDAMAIVTSDGAVPCGACLQVMAEFAAGPGLIVLLIDEAQKVESTSLGELMPRAFSGGNLKKC